MSWLTKLFATKPKRLELRVVSWEKGNRLLSEDSGWRIASEEDTDRHIGLVYLERVEQ